MPESAVRGFARLTAARLLPRLPAPPGPLPVDLPPFDFLPLALPPADALPRPCGFLRPFDFLRPGALVREDFFEARRGMKDSSVG